MLVITTASGAVHDFEFEFHFFTLDGLSIWIARRNALSLVGWSSTWQ
jgi:hypothetical protein